MLERLVAAPLGIEPLEPTDTEYENLAKNHSRRSQSRASSIDSRGSVKSINSVKRDQQRADEKEEERVRYAALANELQALKDLLAAQVQAHQASVEMSVPQTPPDIRITTRDVDLPSSTTVGAHVERIESFQTQPMATSSISHAALERWAEGPVSPPPVSPEPTSSEPTDATTVGSDDADVSSLGRFRGTSSVSELSLSPQADELVAAVSNDAQSEIPGAGVMGMMTDSHGSLSPLPPPVQTVPVHTDWSLPNSEWLRTMQEVDKTTADPELNLSSFLKQRDDFAALLAAKTKEFDEQNQQNINDDRHYEKGQTDTLNCITTMLDQCTHFLLFMHLMNHKNQGRSLVDFKVDTMTQEFLDRKKYDISTLFVMDAVEYNDFSAENPMCTGEEVLETSSEMKILEKAAKVPENFLKRAYSVLTKVRMITQNKQRKTD